MASKRKAAELRANALLKAARMEREHAALRDTRFLVLLYPALLGCPAAKRRGMVGAARQRAARTRLVQAMNVAVVIAGVGMLAAFALGWRSSALWLLWIGLSASAAGQLVHYVVARVELRELLEHEAGSVHDVTEGTGS